jgi:hypothetical protein
MEELQRAQESKPTVLSSPPPSQHFVPQPAANVVRIEKMKFQSFDGDICKYPEFKTEFVKHITPQCNHTQLAFVLKSYLVDSVREEVSNVGEDYTLMWERLDQKYGNVGKLVDAILYDVKRLSVSGNSHNEVLRMVNIVEKAWRDLERLGEATELCNGTTISIIEKSMTLEMKHVWVKLIASKGLNSK